MTISYSQAVIERRERAAKCSQLRSIGIRANASLAQRDLAFQAAVVAGATFAFINIFF